MKQRAEAATVECRKAQESSIARSKEAEAARKTAEKSIAEGADEAQVGRLRIEAPGTYVKRLGPTLLGPGGRQARRIAGFYRPGAGGPEGHE